MLRKDNDDGYIYRGSIGKMDAKLFMLNSEYVNMIQSNQPWELRFMLNDDDERFSI